MGSGALVFAVWMAGGAPASIALPHAGGGTPAREAEILVLSGRYPSLVPYHVAGEGDRFAFVFASSQGTIHHVRSDAAGLREDWRSFPIGPVSRLFVDDLDQDGRAEIVALSTESIVYVWDSVSYDLVWESRRELLGVVSTMTIANVDSDDPLELVLAAGNRIVVYDGGEFAREREGRDRIAPNAILVGDVDGDGRDEVVTNDGFVFDARTLTIEWIDARGFGYPMSLFDLNGDGRPEVVGEVGGALRFWDLRSRRELWWPVPRVGGAQDRPVER